ncbi:MAG: rhodanese-like domain-containing protein [Acidimicrobiales bacterium]
MPDPTPIPEVDVAVFAVAHADGGYVLDVRQPDEYEAVHVPGAILIPLDQLGDRIDEVPKDQHLYVICRSGGRSAAAVEALTGAGYRATNVAGGTLGWIKDGHPTVTGPDAGER